MYVYHRHGMLPKDFLNLDNTTKATIMAFIDYKAEQEEKLNK